MSLQLRDTNRRNKTSTTCQSPNPLKGILLNGVLYIIYLGTKKIVLLIGGATYLVVVGWNQCCACIVSFHEQVSRIIERRIIA